MPGYPRQYGIHCSLLELEQQLLANFQTCYAGRMTVEDLLDDDDEATRFCEGFRAEHGYKAPRFFLLMTLREAAEAAGAGG